MHASRNEGAWRAVTLAAAALVLAATGCPDRPSSGGAGESASSPPSAGSGAGGSRVQRTGYHPTTLGETHAIDVRVRYTGARRAPSWDIPPMVRSQCGGAEKVSDQALSVADDGGVDDAVVWLDDIHEGAPLPEGTTTVQDEKGCVLGPHVLAMGATGTLKLTNSDPANHAVRFELKDATTDARDEALDFTKTLPAGASYGVEVKPDWGGHYARATCPIHLWMWGYVHFFDHPYFAVTHAGAARLEKVPPGQYHLRVWHEGTGLTFDSSLKFPPPETARAEVTVAQADAKVSFTMNDEGKLRTSD